MSTRMTDGTIALERSRLSDFVTLTKPELTFLSVLTALGGAYLGLPDVSAGTLVLIHVMVGTLLLGGGAGALNQFIEREFDRLMKRTENRPIPSGRVSAPEALIFGIILSVGGLLYLSATTNLLTATLGCITLWSYLFLYTPLKRETWLATIVGGIPGALPPVMGWTAATGRISEEAAILFLILFFWQMPHFFSLAWMYRNDYQRAGYPMLTVLDEGGSRTCRQIMGHMLGLIVCSFMLVPAAGLGWLYSAGAGVLGSLFLWTAILLSHRRSNRSARTVFFASLAYLPLLLVFVVLDSLLGL